MYAFTLMLAMAIAGFFQDPAPSVRDLAWMSGCWEISRPNRHVVEQWSAVAGGTLIGTSRTVANDKTSDYEFLLIREGGKGLEYVAKPSRQPEAVFTSTTVAANEVVFENPAHDFPKKISYKRTGDALIAAIEGPMNGQPRKIEFPYKRAACGGS
jgi:hypothetical protein